MFAPLGSYMHLEMCQSLMLTAEATLGQRCAPPRSWLDITQPRRKKKKASCQNGDYSFKIHESHAVKYGCRQGASALVALVGYEMKLKMIHVDS